MTKPIRVSEILDKQLNNGNGQIHALQQSEDSYQAAYEAGLASGKEEGYRRGYREGFADCIEFGNSGLNATLIRVAAANVSKEAVANRARLRGLPCANCGCPIYSDQVKCPRCGNPKAATVGGQPGAVQELQ